MGVDVATTGLGQPATRMLSCAVSLLASVAKSLSVFAKCSNGDLSIGGVSLDNRVSDATPCFLSNNCRKFRYDKVSIALNRSGCV